VKGSGIRPTVDVVIPTLNEAHVLEKSVRTLRDFLGAHLAGYDWRIVVADNGSSDGTDKVARSLAASLPDVRGLFLSERGRGNALRRAWRESTADIVCYMDVDLSTELTALPRLLDAIALDGFDIAIGSRLARGSRIERSLRREAISRCYNLLVRLLLRTRFSDAQCGFKAISRRVVEEIVPLVKDGSWFFDTELLVLAEKHGFRIKDVPVLWIEDNDSRVRILPTALADIRGLLRLRRTLARGLPVRTTKACAPDPGTPGVKTGR
jgi:glycosyltransferase involved in cell wall biosynthesis